MGRNSRRPRPVLLDPIRLYVSKIVSGLEFGVEPYHSAAPGEARQLAALTVLLTVVLS